ncbi:APC family permease [Rhodoblastus sp.]|uniref:APC family permease n=3 Tax=Rhodoblastus sp. TaxID=1962975 RepID=UPI003FD7050A
MESNGKNPGAPSPFGILTRVLRGRPLANREGRSREIGVAEGVPALGLDGLSSSAYGPEAALSILVAAGAAGLASLGPVMLVILALLAILFASYWQTIKAYPISGGAYTVAKENLGVNASLLASAGIMVDYVLNVAVGISAGVAALVSAVPALHPYTLPLCLGILVVLTFVNLRGTMDAGRLFALPTYLFIACFMIVIALGAYAALTSGGHPQPVAPPPAPPKAVEAVGPWLLLRAFASGCTAMTGVEAISNGVDAFRAPCVANARRTLAAIVVTLGILLGGVAYLAMSYGVMATDQTQPGYQSVLSQLVGAVAGRGIFYYVAIGSALCVLCLSASTSFVGLPRLYHVVAQDAFLPRPFAIFGRRLVSSVGIVFLALTAGLLLTVFDGITDRLIPLFAIGAFLTFTISQAGMVAHWRRELRDKRLAAERRRVWINLVINAIGASTTVTALVVIIVAKFAQGGWITIVAIPCVIVLHKAIKRYYDDIDDQLRDKEPLKFQQSKPPIVLVTVEEWNLMADKVLGLAMELSSNVTAVRLATLEGRDVKSEERKLRAQWAKNVEEPARAAHFPHPPQLAFLSAPYRRIHAPFLKLIKEIEDKNPDRTIAVLIPELVKQHWWEYLLSAQHARRLRSAVLAYGGPRVVVIAVPWYLTPPTIEDAMTEEEAAEPFRIRNVFRFRLRRSRRKQA